MISMTSHTIIGIRYYNLYAILSSNAIDIPWYHWYPILSLTFHIIIEIPCYHQHLILSWTSNAIINIPWYHWYSMPSLTFHTIIDIICYHQHPILSLIFHTIIDIPGYYWSHSMSWLATLFEVNVFVNRWPLGSLSLLYMWRWCWTGSLSRSTDSWWWRPWWSSLCWQRTTTVNSPSPLSYMWTRLYRQPMQFISRIKWVLSHVQNWKG